MNLTTALYLTDVVANTDCILTIFFVIGFFISAFSFIAWSTKECNHREDKEEAAFWLSILKKSWILAVMVAPMVAIPNKSTMYMMMGASYLQESNLPTKVSKALELRLDKYIEELTVEKKGE